MDNRENTSSAGQNEPAAAQAQNAADSGARAKEANEVSNTSPVGDCADSGATDSGATDSGAKDGLPQPGIEANADNEGPHTTNAKDEADSAEDDDTLDDIEDEDWWEWQASLEEDENEEPSREEVLLGQLAVSDVLDAGSDPDEALVFDTFMAEVDNNDNGASNDKVDAEEDTEFDTESGEQISTFKIQLTTLHSPQAAWEPPVELCEFGTIHQLKTLPGYQLNNSTGALIRVLGRQIFSKLSCYAAFRDEMCRNGVDALGEVWMAGCASGGDDEQNREAMGDILRRYQLVAQTEPARVSAGQLSFSVMEGYLPKIGLVVTDNTSILFVHENEENGCPHRRLYLYAWPRKEETCQKAASLSELAEQDENAVVHLSREIPANEFFVSALDDLKNY
jgi:hypothetical protein